jgi:tripartite ATP-independent transporter DctP family solute receptor
MQRSRCFVSWSLLLVLVAACGCSKTSDSEPEVVLKLGHGLPTAHPVHEAMVFMAQRVNEKSNGRMRVEVFPNEQLGTEKESIEALQLGYMAMTKISSAPMENFVEEMKIFGIPYLFRDAEHFWNALSGPIGKELLLAGQAKRLRGLCYYDAGARSFYTKQREIQIPADLAGMKIRVQNSAMSMKLVSALDQGVVDGAENNSPSFRQSRHYEVCKYYILDEHTRLPDMLMIGVPAWNNLSPEQQNILQEAVDESVEYQRKIWTEAEQADLKAVEEAGITVIHPDKAPFRESVKSVWQEFEGTKIGDLIERIQEVQ